MKISLVTGPYYQQNKIFDATNLKVNRDDCQRQYIELREQLLKADIELNTNDVTAVEVADIVLFINIPDKRNPDFQKAIQLKKICYAIVNELDLIHVANSDMAMHEYFHKIFTYQQNFIDNIKYFKVNYSFDFNKKYSVFKVRDFQKKKLAVLIAGNKSLNHPLELYSERVKTIRWFEYNRPAVFDLYGFGWRVYKGRLHAIFGKKDFPSYRGEVKYKCETLSNYRFNICYENARDIPGWITEKIFDSFFAGTVPVYWGWGEIDKYVDPSCFIKRADFASNEEMYKYLSSMSEIRYHEYISNIESLLLRFKDDMSNEFSIQYFVNTIVNQILNDRNL